FHNQGFRNGDAVTYLAPAPVSFHSTDVHDSITPFFGGSTINLTSTGDLQIGDPVIYETNDTTGTPIGGLVNGHTYEVVGIQGTAIQLADPSVSGLPISLSPDTSARAASATEELRKLPIRGLQNGVTYYVTNATGS